ncbi:TPA: ogr/Delta-like zinc finger family protein [Stenotrophomonas maltophilia]|jgi:hypothetical protein|uniref:Zinc finger Ogr/Delta-type domain-containing protein n=1 Tax=Stenotrophomonas maltophilia TaxID=40324 RepID=A0AB34TGP0_STEMA|nr:MULTISPECIES: ogr/Delta-like zinc finger family protein [Stenotrophomonas]EKT4070348.1 ogr/Delta-like zinc finger family protein [Stenotrophomonas maltophilia]EKT4079205.1 ogr/Delta-like zinc finger family protein [Stenotrophomonas maltophilia]EZP46990.1 Ogr/Delta-like zinc finger [Stenotrophomonas sp. RIT309]KOO82284.1 hypothetical protein VL23_03055 [Stenotrophomonas maltophilia]MBA0371170.1 hypothetical protein [Stenotrophomonas maltophilia]
MSSHSARRKVVFRCPFCHSPLVKRTSHLSHDHLRHDSFNCTNPVCSAAFTGHTELTGVASPSGLPDARPTDLPPSPAYAREIAQRAHRMQHSGNQPDLLDALPLPADH